jgi:hypothetical protein
MLTASAKEIESVLSGLHQEERALLELSLRREVADAALADLLGIDQQAIRQRRSEALERVAAGLDSPSIAHAEDVLVAYWRRGAVVEPTRRAARDLSLVLAAALLVAVLVVGGVLIVDGGDGEDEARPREQRPPAEQLKLGPRVELSPPAGGRASGVARVVRRPAGPRLQLEVEGLPDPGRALYAVWLYENVSEARQLARVPAGGGRLEVSLPAGFERFPFLDVSREPDDGNPNHSGQSVLRAAVRSLIGQ